MSSVRRAVVTAGVVLLSALSSCAPAPWATPTPTPTTPTVVQTIAPPVQNDLSSGSTERELAAGAVTADVTYWSTLRMDLWTANAAKPLSLSLSATVTPDDGQSVHLERATVLVIPANTDETFDPLDPQVDEARDDRGYPVLDPYSFSQTFTIGQVPAAATFVTVQVSYEFLVQTTPTSDEYAKQTASDTLTIAIAPS